MKAIVYSNPGLPEVLQLQEVATPAPKDHEVLIRIHATTVMATDSGASRSKAPGASRSLHPRHPAIVIPGQDLAGEVEAVGGNIYRGTHDVGSQVYAMFAGVNGQIGLYVEARDSNGNVSGDDGGTVNVWYCPG